MFPIFKRFLSLTCPIFKRVVPFLNVLNAVKFHSFALPHKSASYFSKRNHNEKFSIFRKKEYRLHCAQSMCIYYIRYCFVSGMPLIKWSRSLEITSPEIFRDIQRYSEIFRDIQRYSEI